MARPARVTFLERRTYRRRRLADLARLMPVIGLVLLLVPLLWQEGPGGMPTSRAIYWIFGVWVGLVAVTAWLASRRLESELDTQGTPRPLPEGEREGRR